MEIQNYNKNIWNLGLFVKNLVIADIFILPVHLHFVIRENQRLFSVKYLFGEANIA